MSGSSVEEMEDDGGDMMSKANGSGPNLDDIVNGIAGEEEEEEDAKKTKRDLEKYEDLD